MKNILSLLYTVIAGSALIISPAISSIESALASKVIYDSKCHVAKPSAEDSNEEPFFKANFESNGQKYLLVGLRYQDGSGLLCVSPSDIYHLQLVSAQDIQNSFIDKVTKKTKNSFLVTIYGGNGSNVPIYDFRVTFDHPYHPTIKLIRKYK